MFKQGSRDEEKDTVQRTDARTCFARTSRLVFVGRPVGSGTRRNWRSARIRHDWGYDERRSWQWQQGARLSYHEDFDGFV